MAKIERLRWQPYWVAWTLAALIAVQAASLLTRGVNSWWPVLLIGVASLVLVIGVIVRRRTRSNQQEA